ncbi:lipopolysaccharide biosynthesis regulator YciM [Psychromicrobium silvestre]|uniref:Lipopolysaccharide biosynthesis regulator YciM n=1 Tax=Psychromicrobium silvestre TaxID=1645614 RepID=A0A7Y9LRN2_9MICC|nr:hypothetical protein [Psychromicrobium silvestre]NYE94333.1 lipopolysaccharide biosynthesis regulator YciM [Psychromicrobium silvestre]
MSSYSEFSDYSDWPDAGFPGIAINPQTLLCEVIDEEACEQAFQASSDDGERVFVLLARGENNRAAELIAEARLADPGSLRLRILEADLARSVHETERAIRRLRNLVTEYRDSHWESVIRQHLGKAYFVAGQYQSAASSFSSALNQRVAAGAEAALIYSSTVALQRAREMVERAESVA